MYVEASVGGGVGARDLYVNVIDCWLEDAARQLYVHRLLDNGCVNVHSHVTFTDCCVHHCVCVYVLEWVRFTIFFVLDVVVG